MLGFNTIVGATCHTSHAIDLLRQSFDGRLISRNGAFEETIEHLKVNMRDAIAEI